MKRIARLSLLASVLALATARAFGGELDTLAVRRPGLEPRCVNFENPSGAKGAGGQENQGAKGHPSDTVRPGETKVLFDVRDSGVITHIWLTIPPKQMTPTMLRSLRLQMVWDGSKTPAVDVPLGDFFGFGLGRVAEFESALFSCPQKHAFNSYVPMPFRKAARITLKNESAELLPHLFYSIDYTRQQIDPAVSLFFHAAWRRENKTALRRDFEILPRVQGSGRFLGASFGVIADTAYGKAWWGEGEVKMYLDGDRSLPTLIGTGTEDYVGTGWGLGAFNHRYQGCLAADSARHAWSFYRFHVPDPILFQTDCRVTMQQIGGAPKAELMELKARGVPIELVSADTGADSHAGFIEALEHTPPLKLEDAPDGWCNFFRSDDWCATAYFYLDRPENGLPPLAGLQDRIAGIESTNDTTRVERRNGSFVDTRTGVLTSDSSQGVSAYDVISWAHLDDALRYHLSQVGVAEADGQSILADYVVALNGKDMVKFVREHGYQSFRGPIAVRKRATSLEVDVEISGKDGAKTVITLFADGTMQGVG